jgi:glycosyltransferase involved in cell wall biosynthesis
MIETNDIKFSVVIPTRERAATLRHCLRTCLDQTFDDFEVIVSDNDSSPETRAVVDEIASPKIRYYRTPRALSLASSWDFAVSHARGEYVLLIGDDDGLLPHGLAELDKLIRESGQKVIRWDPAFYTWPNCALVGEGDYLRIPFGTAATEIDATTAIENAISFKQLYSTLPMIYNSAVHKDILATIRAKTGRLFSNRFADVYSGFSIAHVAGRFLSTDIPMSVSGQSSASTGVAVFFFRDRSSIDREFRDLNDGEKLRENNQIPDLSIFPYTAVADSFLDAKRLLFPNEDKLILDQKKFIKLCAQNLRVGSTEEWQTGLATLRRTMAEESGGFEWFDKEIAPLEYSPLEPFRLRPKRLGFDGHHLHLDTAMFGIRDVAGAAELCDRILNYRRYGSPDYDPTRSSEVEVALQRVCDERLAVIELLSQRILKLEKRFTFQRLAKAIQSKLKGLLKPFGSRTAPSH